ncbi:MAG: hypothetical protein EAZ07_08945 [Cytophagales bacterium]|nr:MAG: hypothetical protein EAZ07_08945 [Cytophagales bacterium]
MNSRKNIFSILVLLLLLSGIVSKPLLLASQTKPIKVEKNLSKEHKQPTQLLTCHWSVEAIVPIVNFDICQYYCVLFFTAVLCINGLIYTTLYFISFRQKYFKILFENIIAPNAP